MTTRSAFRPRSGDGEADARSPGRRWRSLIGCLAPLTLVFLFAAPAKSAGPEIKGKATVIDGMTLEVRGYRIRLYGVDAPDLEQTCAWPGRTVPCGALARLALMDLVTGGDVACRPRARNADGSLIAVCFGGGFDVGKNMVHTGWALADRRVSRPYIETEEKSRKAKRGLWRGTFVRPSDWRQGKRDPVR